MGAKLIQVIETSLEVRGDGSKTPLRRVTQYYSTDGELLAERDPETEVRPPCYYRREGAAKGLENAIAVIEERARMHERDGSYEQGVALREVASLFRDIGIDGVTLRTLAGLFDARDGAFDTQWKD